MPALKHRHFLLGTAATLGALVVGWSPRPRASGDHHRAAACHGQRPVALNGWVKVSPDDTVTLMMAAAEMGQGIHTGLAMLLAEEMDADLAQLRLEQAGYDPIYNNRAALLDNLPMFKPDDDGGTRRGTRHVVSKLLREVPGLWGSGGSSGIVDQWTPLREAGASARAMLVGAAAAAWGVPAADARWRPAGCRTRPRNAARASASEARAATLPLPAQPTLKDPSRYTLIGRPVHRPRQRRQARRLGSVRARRAAARRTALRHARDVPHAGRLRGALRRHGRARDARRAQGGARAGGRRPGLEAATWARWR